MIVSTPEPAPTGRTTRSGVVFCALTMPVVAHNAAVAKASRVRRAANEVMSLSPCCYGKDSLHSGTRRAYKHVVDVLANPAGACRMPGRGGPYQQGQPHDLGIGAVLGLRRRQATTGQRGRLVDEWVWPCVHHAVSKVGLPGLRRTSLSNSHQTPTYEA
jgi:hypothetical protein